MTALGTGLYSKTRAITSSWYSRGVSDDLSHITCLPPLAWACPACRAPLHASSEMARCPACAMTYAFRDGIWRFLPVRRAASYATFSEQYELIRREEGWGRCDGAYYRMLPDVPPDDPNRKIWKARRATFRTFIRCIVDSLERRLNRPLCAIDLGAGNGWLAYRLARRGHRLVAVDLRTDANDGLGAHVHYDAGFAPVQADFNRLPFASGQFDLAVFNGSLHYAEQCEVTIEEALRVLRPNGALAVLDTPIYPSRSAGRRMVRQREQAFVSRFGFASNSISSEHFLTHERLRELAEAAGISWTIFRPFFGIRWIFRPLAARLLGRRAPADFLVIAAEKSADQSGRVPLITGQRQRILLHPDDS